MLEDNLSCHSSGSIHLILSCLSFETGSLTFLKCTKESRQTGQKDLGMHLSQPLSTKIICTTMLGFFFPMVLGIQTKVSLLTRQTLHQLRISPAYKEPPVPGSQWVRRTASILDLWAVRDASVSRSVSVEQKPCDWVTVTQVWSCGCSSELWSQISWNSREQYDHHIDKGLVGYSKSLREGHHLKYCIKWKSGEIKEGTSLIAHWVDLRLQPGRCQITNLQMSWVTRKPFFP